MKDKYSVKSILFNQVKEWVVKKHYAKRVPPIEYAFGLFTVDNVLIGVITFGTPVSSTLRELWNGEYKLMELNRLVINGINEKNILSYFVSSAMKLLPYPLVIVSYADTSQNHHGYIYQATNFVYTGLSAKRTDYNVEGMEGLHSHTIADISRGCDNRGQALKDMFGDKLTLKDRPRKHRYFYFLGNKREKKQMLSMLPYGIEPYPKGDNVRYDAGYNPTTQKTLF